jgi:hypothetical protein
MAESDDLRVLYIFSDIPIVILEPFREPLNSKSGCSQADSHRLGGKAFVEKKDTFLTPLFDVYQGGLVLFLRRYGQAHNP